MSTRQRNKAVERRERRCISASGVALYQDDIGPLLGKHPADAGQRAHRDVGQALPGGTQVQVIGGLDTKDVVDLIEHLAVLAGHRHHRAHVRRRLQRLHDWGHLHRLWPGAVHDHRGPPGLSGVKGHQGFTLRLW